MGILKQQRLWLKEQKENRPSAGITDDLRVALLAGIDQGANPEQSLAIVQALYGQRVEILPTAWKAAKQSRKFKYPMDLLRLLLLLATDYYDALAKGTADSEARHIFGAHYAATESDRGKKNRRAKGLRTFSHGGKNVEMLRHLKIGVKDSFDNGAGFSGPDGLRRGF